MADEERKLSDSDIAFVKEQARLLAADLAFYARGPVRLHLIGGSAYAFTIDAGGEGSFIDVYMNPKVLFDIRNRERAIAVWRGMGFHELAHHLWPAKEQYEQAHKEGFKDLFNLIEDEQNERRGRAQDPEWGMCFQTTVAWVFRKKGKPEEGYVGRFNEFAYHFRRNLPAGVKEPIVAEALALIPKNLKDLSKPDLLDLVRKVHLVLARGVEVPTEVPYDGKEEEEERKPKPEVDKSAPAPETPIPLPKKPLWKSIFTNIWSYVFFAVCVAGWLYFFGRKGFGGWDDTFWVVVGAALAILGITALAAWLEKMRIKMPAKPGAKATKAGRWETVKSVAGEGWKKTREAVKRTTERVLGAVDKIMDEVLPKPVARFLEFVGNAVRWVFLLVVTIIGGILFALWWVVKAVWWLLKAAWWLITSLFKLGVWTAKALWRTKWFRAFLLAAPVAALIAMAIALLMKAAWWQLLILLLILLLLALLAWFFRKKIKLFVLAKTEPGGTSGSYFDHSREMLEFAVIENIVPIAADEACLNLLLPDVIPLAQQMKPYFERCGLVTVDLEDQDVGHELVDDLERAALGETSLYVDDEKQPRASVHIEVIIDCSGSMNLQKLLLAKRFGLLVEESIRGVRGISAHFWGFTDHSIYDCGEPGQYRISGLNSGGGNNDAGALWHAYQNAMKSGKELKILLMVSDGMPTECTWGSLNNLVLNLEGAGYVPVQVAVDHIADPAFQRYFVDLVGQPMPTAIIEFGRMLLALVEDQR